jgi:MFS family permease
LTIIRLIQGIGVGGEWGGSVLLAMEWARTNKNRGFLAWPQFGGPAGLFLANLAVLFFSWLSGDQFLVWGWRIPFLLSIVMVGIGLWIRLGILETPVFRKLRDHHDQDRDVSLDRRAAGWRLPTGDAFSPQKLSSQWTRRWREPDSN